LKTAGYEAVVSGGRVTEDFIFIRTLRFDSCAADVDFPEPQNNVSTSNLFQNDILHSTIYDIVYEEEHQEIYNILLNPPKTAIDPHQNKVSPENQICFLAHLKRGSLDNPPKILYEYVQFTGYFSEFSMKFRYLFTGLTLIYCNCQRLGDNGDGENSSRYNNSGENSQKTLFVGTGE
jgi:hypothetical protein